MLPSTMATKWPILVSQCGMDHLKPTILLIFGTLSLAGHPIRSKLNLKDKGQMSKPNEYTDNFKSNLTCIFLLVRAKLKNPLCPRTLCMNYESQIQWSVSIYLCYTTSAQFQDAESSHLFWPFGDGINKDFRFEVPLDTTNMIID